MPPSSLYCTQKSVSRISAAAANRSRAASPGVSPCCAKADELVARSPTPAVAAPAAASPFFRKERRLVATFMLVHMFCIRQPPLAKLEFANQSLSLHHNDLCHRNVKKRENMVIFSSRGASSKTISATSKAKTSSPSRSRLLGRIDTKKGSGQDFSLWPPLCVSGS